MFQFWSLPLLLSSLFLLAEATPLSLEPIKAKAGSPASWFPDLPPPTLWFVCVFSLLRNGSISFDTHPRRGLSPFLVFWYAVFHVLFRVLCLCDTLFTALLNYKYLLAFTLQHLLFFLLKSTQKLFLGFSSVPFSLFLAGMFLPLFLTHSLHCKFFHFHLDR